MSGKCMQWWEKRTCGMKELEGGNKEVSFSIQMKSVETIENDHGVYHGI